MSDITDIKDKMKAEGVKLEDLANARDEISIKEKSEIGEIFENLDADDISKISNMPAIDFNTRLTPSMIKGIAVFDEFKAMGIMPRDSTLTLLIKRLHVSLQGKGRQEKVTIASASRSATLEGRGGGIGGFMKGLVTPKQ
jgi:hypothetical protein